MDIKTNARSFYERSLRVWHVLRKPSKKEFETIAKASTVGILIIGAMGFLVQLIMKIFVK
jgi:protein transport protein SEC61 subunit gamma-like protein